MKSLLLRAPFWLATLVACSCPSVLIGQEKGAAAAAEAEVAAQPDQPMANQVEPPQIEVCFVLDTTGSMGGLIQGAKDKIWSIANELVAAQPAPQLKFGLIGYRDRGDAYVTNVTGLTDDLDEIHTQLMAFKAAGGGDSPESVNQALNEAVTQMTWATGAKVLKIVFLVGDAPPHMDYDETRYPEICKVAMEKNLIINTIQCGSVSGTAGIWSEIAQQAAGQYTSILQSGGTVAIATPFDPEISELNVKLNGTVVCYGDDATQKSISSKIMNNEGSKSEAIADRAKFYSRSRRAGGRLGRVVGGHADLVEQVMNNEADMDSLDKSKLPAELRDLSDEEQKAAIKKKVAERKVLQAKMAALVKKRSEYIKSEKKKQAAGQVDSFDMKVKEMIKDQGATRGIKFNHEK